MKPNFFERVEKTLSWSTGALGSYLYEQGGLNRPYCEEYIRAGSQLIETNTSGAKRLKISKAGADKQVIDINRAGAEIGAKVEEPYKPDYYLY